MTELKLWKILKDHLIHYAAANSDSKSKLEVESLLSGKSFPAKANLIARFQRTPDLKAKYVDLPNPFLDPRTD